MDQPIPDTDLVVATPERVSFDYQVAGLGTRGIAQILGPTGGYLMVYPLVAALAGFIFERGARTFARAAVEVRNKCEHERINCEYAAAQGVTQASLLIGQSH